MTAREASVESWRAVTLPRQDAVVPPIPLGSIDLATAELPAHPRVRAFVADLADSDDDEAAALFDLAALPRAGLPALRGAVAAHLTDRGLVTAPGQVLITTGERQSLSLLAAHSLRSKDIAIVEDPTSPFALDVLLARSAVVRVVRPVTDGDDNLVHVLERSAPRLVYLVPTLGPRGRVLDAEVRHRLAWTLAGRRALVVEDVGQSGLAFGTVPPPLAAHVEAANLVTLGSLGAVHWGGLRAAWIRATEPLVAELAEVMMRTEVGASALDQLLAARLLTIEDEVRVERVAWLRECLGHATAVLSAVLPDWTWRPPDGGPSLWLRVPSDAGGALVDAAARHGVAITPEAAFSPRNSAGHVRLVYARPPDVFDEGIRRLAAAWRQCAP